MQNEALCLVLAGRCGLNASRVTTGKVGERTYLLVTRYDRLEQAGRWRRLHQEDFCQALGKPPSAKYEANQSGIKGPTLIDMFALTRNAMRAPDVLHLLDYVLFNVLVCNTDAHAKNYSLMISGRGFSLAPTYDVMCAAAWDGITRNLAQNIAGKNRGEHLERSHWEVVRRRLRAQWAAADQARRGACECGVAASESRRGRGRCNARRHARVDACIRRGHRSPRPRDPRGIERRQAEATDPLADDARFTGQEEQNEKSKGVADEPARRCWVPEIRWREFRDDRWAEVTRWASRCRWRAPPAATRAHSSAGSCRRRRPRTAARGSGRRGRTRSSSRSS